VSACARRGEGGRANRNMQNGGGGATKSRLDGLSKELQCFKGVESCGERVSL
jgi:hypothetical protein